PITTPEPELALTPPSIANPDQLRDMAALHSAILSRLGAAPVAEDQLLRDIKAKATDVAPVLVNLELEGKIARQSGGLLARVV
ncbi:MAG: DNA-protecting protein DprA, partial [Pseudomonadota bacterium]